MLEIERIPIPTEHSRLPTIRPEGIQWRTLGDTLRITVELANESLLPSEPARLHVEAAAFGAFVPGERVASLPVGSIGPRRTHRVAVDVPRKVVDRLNPTGLREGLALLQAEEWAGNLNVYFDGGRATEVHRALDLQVRGGHSTGVMFLIHGSDRVHAGDFGVAVQWDAPGWSFSVGGEAWQFAENEAAFASDHAEAYLVVQPPWRFGSRARAEVEVTRPADGRTVRVEFGFTTVRRNLDPARTRRPD